jgi:hypothetical protein
MAVQTQILVRRSPAASWTSSTFLAPGEFGLETDTGRVKVGSGVASTAWTSLSYLKAGTATTLETARNINGVSFNGSADITVTAAAGTLTGTTLNSTVVSSSLTSVGTITTGTWSGLFGAVTGANLTNLTAGNLTGTIPSGVLGSSTLYVGSTAVALNRATGNLALTGISSITLPGSTSGTVQLLPTAVSGTTVLTLPAPVGGSGTIALTSDLPTVNNGTLTLAVAGTGLSGSATFTANSSTSPTFTVTSNATNANTASTIVARDASGNFSAGTITATLSGAATSATTATNIAAGAAGDLLYQSASGTTSKLGIGTSSFILTSNGSAPTWTDPASVAYGTATNATYVATTNDTTSSTAKYLTWVGSASGNNAITVTSTKLTFNPSTGILTSTGFSGSGALLTGIPNSALSNSTISGVSLGNNLAALTIGTGLSGGTYNGGTAATIALATAYGDTTNPFSSKTANYVLAAPNGSAGTPGFRALVAADIPTIAQSQVTNLTTDLSAKAPLVSPSFTTPSLGVATATSINGTTIPTSSTLLTSVSAIPESQVTNLTTDLAAKAPLSNPTFTGSVYSPTFNVTGNTGQVSLTLQNSPTGSVTMYVPISGTSLVSNSGAAFTGAVTASSFNKLSITQPATGSTLAIADGKALTVNNTVTLANIASQDGFTFYFPGVTGGTILTSNASATLTNSLTLRSGTSTAGQAPLYFGNSSPTVLTTPVAGAVEYDGGNLFLTPDAVSGRSIVATPHYYVSTTSADYTVASPTTAAQPIYAASGSGISLNAYQVYEVEGTLRYQFTIGTTSLSSSFQLAYSGASTVAQIAVDSWVNTTGFTSSFTTQFRASNSVNTAVATTNATTSTTAYVTVNFKGIIRTTNTGTLTPKVSFSSVTGLTSVKGLGNSWIKVTPLFAGNPASIPDAVAVGAWV